MTEKLSKCWLLPIILRQASIFVLPSSHFCPAILPFLSCQANQFFQGPPSFLPPQIRLWVLRCRRTTCSVQELMSSVELWQNLDWPPSWGHSYDIFEILLKTQFFFCEKLPPLNRIKSFFHQSQNITFGLMIPKWHLGINPNSEGVPATHLSEGGADSAPPFKILL